MQDHKTIYPVLFICTALVYLIGMCCIPMMEIDAAQYASISEELIRGHHLLRIQHMGVDYLDKPPLLFWLSALAIKLLGTSSFAYKLFSVAGSALAIYSTYKFSRLYYSHETARYAALLLASCQAFFIMAQDCRTDNLLIGFCCFSLWKISSYILFRKHRDLYIGFVGIGLAMLAKGPLGLIFPVFAVGSILFTPKNIRSLDVRWLWSIPIVLIILAPMCVGLYQQYGWKGLEFYFWTQSFGRITGQSTWANDTGPLYFVHTFLWSFLPYSLMFIPAFWLSIKHVFKQNAAIPEYGTLGGFILTFFALSLSNYKLPHYIYIVCPLASILVARLLLEGTQKWFEFYWFKAVQIIVLSSLLVIPIALVYLFDRFFPYAVLLIIPGLCIGYWLVHTYSGFKKRLLHFSILSGIIGNLILNALFYPRLLKYQSSSEVAFYMLKQKIPAEQLIAYKKYGHALSYYLHTGIPYETDLAPALAHTQNHYVYTNDQGLSDFKNADIPFEIVQRFDDFPVTRLKYTFINPATRHEVITSAYLVKLKR